MVTLRSPGQKPNTWEAQLGSMLGRIIWGLGKFTVKHVVVPIAITALTAVVLQKLADRVDPDHANGRVVSSTGMDRSSMAV